MHNGTTQHMQCETTIQLNASARRGVLQCEQHLNAALNQRTRVHLEPSVPPLVEAQEVYAERVDAVGEPTVRNARTVPFVKLVHGVAIVPHAPPTKISLVTKAEFGAW